MPDYDLIPDHQPSDDELFMMACNEHKPWQEAMDKECIDEQGECEDV